KTNLLKPYSIRGHKHIDEAENIDPRVKRWIGHGTTHVHLRPVMVQYVGFDLPDQPGGFRLCDIQRVNRGPMIEILFLTRRKIINDMNLVSLVDVSVDNMRSNEPRTAGNNDFHAFDSCRRARKYSMVFCNPPLSFTCGSQARIFFALVISGCRTCGSSCGRGLYTMELWEPVRSRIFLANCRTVISQALPMLTGSCSSDCTSRWIPSSRSTIC